MASRVPSAYIFDGVDGGDLASMNERVAECYRWAEDRGVRVLDEVVSWAPRESGGRLVALTHAVSACHRSRAVLLIHSAAVLPRDTPPRPR